MDMREIKMPMSKIKYGTADDMAQVSTVLCSRWSQLQFHQKQTLTQIQVHVV